MKYNVILFISLFAFYSCTDEDALTDLETNRYYADYLEIYNNSDSVGIEGTLVSLDEYLEEYPERVGAYNFKAYLFCKMGKYDDANLLFDQVREMDSLHISSYEIQTAFLLRDSTQWDIAYKLLQEGMAIEDSSAVLMNNLAWYQILNGDSESALATVSEGLRYQSKNNNLFRTDFVLACLLEDEIHWKETSILVVEKKLGDVTDIKEKLKQLGPYHYYQTLE